MSLSYCWNQPGLCRLWIQLQNDDVNTGCSAAEEARIWTLRSQECGQIARPNTRKSTIKQGNVQKLCIEKNSRNLHCALKGMKIEIQISLDSEGKTDSWKNWCSRFYRLRESTSSKRRWWKRRIRRRRRRGRRRRRRRRKWEEKEGEEEEKEEKKKDKKKRKNCLHNLLFQTSVMVHLTALYIHVLPLHIKRISRFHCDTTDKCFTVTNTKTSKTYHRKLSKCTTWWPIKQWRQSSTHS